MAHLVNGRPAEAVPLLEQAIAGDPRHGMALEHLGFAHLLLGQFPNAERVLRRAATLPGAPASVSMRLGVSLLHQQKHEEAIRHLQRALTLDPRSADCHLNLGQALAQMDDATAAGDHFQAVLRLEPGHVDATFNLGVLALQRDELDEARRWFERALARSPQYVDAMTSLGIVLQKEGRLAEAREQYLAALKIAPGFSAAHEGMAFVCLALGRPGEAIGHLKTKLQAEPENRTALSALAAGLFEVGQLHEAEAAAQRVCTLDPSDAAAHATLANIYIVRGELDRAIATLESGYAQTNASNLLGMLAHQLKRICAWDKWRPIWSELSRRLDHESELGSPFWLLYEPTTAGQQLAYTRRWAQARFGFLAAASSVHPPRRAAGRGARRLRVGYLSSDLQQHAAAYLLAGVLERHDRERFEIFAYSYGPDDRSSMRERIRSSCEHFVDVAWDPDDVVVRRIESDDLDILIDLKGYTLGARTAILAQRPCRVQVNWLGYPGTMGASFIDYLIADGFVIPPGKESVYLERVVRLNHCWQSNDRQRPVGEPCTRGEYGLPDEGFVFCCFTQTVKITPDVFAHWMNLLGRVPGSVLWLAEDNGLATENLKDAARVHGVAPERLVFAPRAPFPEYLARYRVADLALDTFPYTSHSTGSDAVWAGCPLVALCGDTFAARVSGSILAHCGLSEFITHTLDDYETLAYKLAIDPDFHQSMRSAVAAARSHGQLFDAESFTRDLERVYVDIAIPARP